MRVKKPNINQFRWQNMKNLTLCFKYAPEITNKYVKKKKSKRKYKVLKILETINGLESFCCKKSPIQEIGLGRFQEQGTSEGSE